MKDEEVFLARFQGLQRFSADEEPSLDGVLNASVALRLLLLDDGGLLPKVTATVARPVIFHVHPPIDRGTKQGVLVDIGFGENMPPFGGGIELTLKEYCNYPLVTLLDETYSVKHLIWLVSNSLGGTHVGKNHRPMVERLRQRDEGSVRGDASWGGDFQWSINLIRNIARTTVYSCTPFYFVLRARSF